MGRLQNFPYESRLELLMTRHLAHDSRWLCMACGDWNLVIFADVTFITMTAASFRAYSVLNTIEEIFAHCLICFL